MSDGDLTGEERELLSQIRRLGPEGRGRLWQAILDWQKEQGSGAESEPALLSSNLLRDARKAFSFIEQHPPPSPVLWLMADFLERVADLAAWKERIQEEEDHSSGELEGE
ncbi:MAG TPA: hypothetical protein VNL15_03905 [Dehalococcoidia bacterium]|nr:hypothetical protein [Dehalococcoidia bacterium]